MRVLVTGGAGFVGSTLVPMLLADGHHVRVLDVLRYGGQGLLAAAAHPNFEFVNGDVCDEETIATALTGADAIVHLAAIVGYPACKKDPQLATRVNVEGTHALLAHRRPDQKIVYASTGSIYGRVPDYLCHEGTPLAPITLYGETKATAERAVLAAGNAVAFRYATAFGVSPRMRLDLLPNEFAYQAVANRSLIVYERSFKRTFLHVSDLARSMVWALRTWDAVVDDAYNVGSEDMNLTKEDLARKLLEHVDYYLHFAEVGSDADMRDYEVSYAKIRGKGFRPRVGMEEGLAELVRAVRLIEFRSPYGNV
ncbi:membrane protein [Actinorhabdospora filicis]|uniref:Membrane protein n=1 Tax=Actinorhabdospora filicis TaxID=1785913 RepID=A0A9W6SFM7_9ACTN|nr:NAD-dependent epimerase/dehydratase [Actinorhabdospora filicis]GLZ75438.1 membrane protein [Actinorhabdospora filicis]